MPDYIMGIDLGTSNSCMAVVRPTAGGVFLPEILYNIEGQLTTPSVVALTAKGDWLVGQEAKGQAILNPENTVFSAKRLIGRSFDDATVGDDAVRTPYRLTRGEGNSVRIELDGRGGAKEVLAPEQISAKVLRKLKTDAEATLGITLSRAVITVPAYFDPNQREATLGAAKIAGFDGGVRLISEPTAAALAYGQHAPKEAETLLVFDLGGGTLDVTIIRHRADPAKGDRYVSRTITGNTHLGGDDFDRAIMDWMEAEFKRETSILLGDDPKAMQRIRDAAEGAKIELSGAKPEAAINLPFIAVGPDGQPRAMALTLTRAKLEELTASLVQDCISCCKTAMADAALTTDQIDSVLLVGGQTKMPAVQRAVEMFFGKAPSRAVNPDQAVAIGAALLGNSLLVGGRAITEGDEEQGGAGEGAGAGSLQIIEVSSQPLGVRLVTNEFSEIIAKGSTLPASRTRGGYTTVEDGQTKIKVEVFQGQNRLCSANKHIGDVLLENIPPMRIGEAKLEVTFTLSLDNLIRVKAKETTSGREVEAVLEIRGAMSERDLQRAKETEKDS